MSSLFIGGSERDAYFNLLKQKYETASYKEINKDLVWMAKPSLKEDVVRLMADFDPADRETWPQQHQWLKDTLERFEAFFTNKIRNLNISEYVE
ncbi:MAG: DUF4268 domain-containing protein [Patescibacteria group bacterium]|nr:DUF4268 domain-containing protein [Patescibacteria group bacterium]